MPALSNQSKEHYTNVLQTLKRTLGVITKPDRLDPDSGSETKFLELARNEDVFFKLGWHVVKNRAFKEQGFSMEERNASEQDFLTTSNFRVLPDESLGIDALRVRLSLLLLQHVKKELPRLRGDLENALMRANNQLKALGNSRSTLAECRGVLAEINMGCYELCKAGLGGHYDQDFFRNSSSKVTVDKEKLPTVRLRAIIQSFNNKFSDDLRKTGHKYHFLSDTDQPSKPTTEKDDEEQANAESISVQPATLVVALAQPVFPILLGKGKAVAWAKKALHRCRGTELVGNFNPNLIAELFWEQSEGWERAARMHIGTVYKSCDQFLRDLLNARAPLDMRPKLW